MDFLIVNGEIVSKTEANLTGFLWDEPFTISQKVWFGYGGIPLFNENIDFISRQLQELKLLLPDNFRNTRELFRITKRMLNKNKFYRSGIVHFQLFISRDKINTLVTSIAFPEFEFPFSMHGLLVNFSGLKKNAELPLNRFQFYNMPNWVTAEAQNRDTQFHSSILVNEKNKVCGGLFSNIFMVKENVLYTPSFDTGCYEDTLRSVVIEQAHSMNLKVAETSGIGKEVLLSMDEIFFASEELGIQWILGVENKRFVHNYSAKIHEKINEYLKKKAEG
ncbi:MAG: aminotransferase class IV [Bacteroidota bacterium]